MAVNKRRIIWSKIALERLGDIHFWHVFDHSERRADKVITSIEKAVNEVSTFPFAAPIFDEIDPINDSIRAKLVENTYKIVFKVDDLAIYIIEIYHAAQNPDLSGIDIL